MREYYVFLFQTTWPAVVMFFFIGSFGIYRIVDVWIRMRSHLCDILDYMAGAMKTALWMIVLAIYFFIFYTHHGDWFRHPLVIQSDVQSMEQVVGRNEFLLRVNAHAESQEFIIDETTFLALQPGESVKLTYLPILKRVIKCEVLSR